MQKNTLRIPPNYVGIGGACIAGIWGTAIRLLGWESIRRPPYMNSIGFFWLGIGVLAISLFYYTFDEDQLTVRWLGIPLRKIPYERISGVVWITKSNKRTGITFHHALVFTLAPYQLTDKVIDSINYRRRNLFRTVFIYLPGWKDDAYFRRLKNFLKSIPLRELDYPTIGG